VAAPHDDARDPGSHVVLESTEVAVVEATRLVVGRDELFGRSGVSHLKVREVIINYYLRLEMEDKGDVRNQFLRSLSNYSECIKPYLRTA